NPDVLCNREIKFDIFLHEAEKLGADFVATGHYCQKGEENGRFKLLAGADKNKDQSYFLCQLTQKQLSKALFPIGHLQKSKVREIAQEQDLITADKKDSQGLCFIGKVKLPVFLQQKLEPKEGDIIELSNDLQIFRDYSRITDSDDYNRLSKAFNYKESDGEIVGKHQGAHYFTIGQRKGLAVGGTPLPLFVIGTDVEKNIIYTGQGDAHQGLNKNALFIEKNEVHWLRDDLKLEFGESRQYDVRIRYRQELVSSTLHMHEEGLYIHFSKAMTGISPGQFAAWYNGEELIGSGVIGH
ncbi:MAG: tRNA 2-thiouridine(34) synthase MnmA, partial [Crocinitomix sp. MedPE-SWsnd]